MTLLLADAQAMAVELASGPATAFGRIKGLLDASDRATLADQLDAEAARSPPAPTTPRAGRGRRLHGRPQAGLPLTMA